MSRNTQQRRTPLTERQHEWLVHIEAAEQAGIAFSHYADTHGLSAAGLYAARHVLREKGWLVSSEPEPVEFATVEVVEAVEGVDAQGLSVHLRNGVRV